MPSFCRRISTIGWAFCITCCASSAGTKPTRKVRVWLSVLPHAAARQSARRNFKKCRAIDSLILKARGGCKRCGSGLFRRLMIYWTRPVRQPECWLASTQRSSKPGRKQDTDAILLPPTYRDATNTTEQKKSRYKNQTQQVR